MTVAKLVGGAEVVCVREYYPPALNPSSRPEQQAPFPELLGWVYLRGLGITSGELGRLKRTPRDGLVVVVMTVDSTTSTPLASLGGLIARELYVRGGVCRFYAGPLVGRMHR